MRLRVSLVALLLLGRRAGRARPAPGERFRVACTQLARPGRGNRHAARARERVEVIRDRWGVPHIYAATPHDLFFAQGFVQAQDRLWQMEMYRRTYEGTLAEIMGPDVRGDTTGSRGCSSSAGRGTTASGRATTPRDGASSTAFADGVNAYIAQAGDRLPVEFQLTGLRPQPWTPEIALLRTQTAMPPATRARNCRSRET